MDNRRAMLAKIHIARKDLGLEDDDYRDVIERVSKGRTRSAGQLSQAALHDLLAEFRRLGWKPKAAALGRGAASDPQSKKVRALWLALAEAGVVRDKSEKALRSYVHRMTGRDDLRFCDPAEKWRLIESLKSWAVREGVEIDG